MSTAIRQRYYKTLSLKSTNADNDDKVEDEDYDSSSLWYREPIVEEKESARIAKEKINDVKKAEATRMQANQVYIKHGSRSRQSNEMNGRTSGGGALPAAVAAISSSPSSSADPKKSSRQPKINDIFAVNKNRDNKRKKDADIVDLTTRNLTQDRNNMSIGNNAKQKSDSSLPSYPREKKIPALFAKQSNHLPNKSSSTATSSIDLTETQVHVSPFKRLKKSPSANNMDDYSQTSHDTILPIATTRTHTTKKISKNRKTFFKPNDTVSREETTEGNWICAACTFSNDKPYGLTCSICGTKR
jgi:hypothetical protein